MINSSFILAFLGAHVIANNITGIAYLLDGDVPKFWSNLLSSIGYFVLLHVFVSRDEKKDQS